MKVLCLYDYEARAGGEHFESSGGVMIDVPTSFFILEAFEAAMWRQVSNSWPRLIAWKLTGYRTECGRAFF